ncbi:LacI family DNA-binding transcriptional regulator [Asticcacaulis solisilvae]|uniref:LacI family DNA-binding transcriptional regulator n=1 Tax=Asticcacaulis solisilvae TaxID=1217274 RepID=UPI003FD7049C
MSIRKTIYDVAILAGVSEATVSRVLNNNPRVSAENRERVLTAAKALRFRPNAQARLLAGGRPNTILLVAPTTGRPQAWYFQLLESGALRGCGHHGLRLQNHFVFPDSPRREATILQPVDAGECDGVILSAPFSDDADIIRALQARHMPLILVASGHATRGLAAGVGMDDEAAGHEMMSYLLKLGHRRFAFSLGLKDHLSARERFDGAARALAEFGLAPSAMVSVEAGLDFDAGYHAFARIRETGAEPTAIICANDESAAGAIHGAHESGLSLPRDLTIVGFDDAPFAKLLSPPLTTISQAIDTMAARAIDILFDVIKAVERPYETVKPRLVVRASAAPPRG